MTESKTPSRPELIRAWTEARKSKNETTDCVFHITAPDIRAGLGSEPVKKAIAMLDKYGIKHNLVDTVPGTWNLNRDWIKTGIIPCAVEYCGVYPVDWSPEDAAEFERMEYEGEILVTVDWLVGGKYVPNH